MIDIDRLAYLGARERRRQIDEEAAALDRFIRDYERRHVPDGAGARARDVGNRASAPAARHGASPAREASPARASTRRRTPMSAARRKAIGERMRKYWAQRRAAEQGKKR